MPLNGITSLPNFTKIYQAVQKIFINTLYLNPAMPLDRFCPRVNNLLNMVHKQSKPTVEQGSPNNFEPQ
jgi:hypothetical protein